jgi:MFS family permease
VSRARPRAAETLYLVCGLIALTQVSWGLIVPVLPLYAKEFGASAFELGVVVSSFTVARLCINIPAGLMADRFNRKVIILAGVGAVGSILLITALVNSLWLLVVTRVLLGLAGGIVITVAQSLLADITEGGARGRAMATLQAFQLAGTSVGPALGGVAAGIFGPRAAFVVGAVVALGMGAVALIRMPSTPIPHPDGGQSGAVPNSPAARPSAWGMFRDRSFVAACITAFGVFFARFGGMQTLVALIAYRSAVGLSSSTFGITLGALAVLNIGMVPVVGRVSETSRKVPIVIAMLMTAVGYVGMSMANGIVLFFVAIVFIGLANGFSGSVPAAYCADILPGSLRGHGIGIYRTFGDFGGLVGPIVVGALVDGWSTSVAAATVAVISGAIALAFATIASETVGKRATHRLIF